jgi:hypothetical protein
MAMPAIVASQRRSGPTPEPAAHTSNPVFEPFTTADIEHPAASEGEAGAYGYIQDVIAAYNTWNGANHPCDALPTDQDINHLELATEDVNHTLVFNYALARVRFRAPQGVDAACGVPKRCHQW